MSRAGDQEISAARCRPPASERLERPARGPAMPTVQRAATPRCLFQAATLKLAARAESRRRAPHGRGGARSLQCPAPAVGGGHGRSMTSQAALDAALPAREQVCRSGRGCGPLPWACSGGWAAAGGWNRTWRTQSCGWRERAQYLVSTCELAGGAGLGQPVSRLRVPWLKATRCAPAFSFWNMARPGSSTDTSRCSTSRCWRGGGGAGCAPC